jgi:hypothetical protein
VGERRVYDYLQRSKLLNDIAQAVTTRIELPVPITIRVGSKGPYYDPGVRTIWIPYEIELLQATGLDCLDPGKRDRIFEGAITFVVGHELGHALIDLLRPSSGDGSEEELADALAVYLSVNLFGKRESVLEVLSQRDGLPPAQPSSVPPANGTLSPARRDSLICQLEGAQVGRRAGIEGAVAAQRRQMCTQAYAQLREMVERLLEPHLKPD